MTAQVIANQRKNLQGKENEQLINDIVLKQQIQTVTQAVSAVGQLIFA